MRRLLTVRVAGWLVVVASFLAFACSKSSENAAGGGAVAAAAPAPPAAASEFDRKWAALASTDMQAFYVEDDRGEGVMGLVSHWAFPRSRKGGLAISYPFVFVGG